MGSVEEPNDIDMIVVLPPDWNLEAEIRPFEYDLLSNKRTRKVFGFDVFAVRAGSEEEEKVKQFFQGINTKWRNLVDLSSAKKKGLVRLVP